MSEVKGLGHILYPVSNQCISFSFHINQTNHSWDLAGCVFSRSNTILVFDLEKTHPKFLKKIWQNNCFQHKFLQNLNRVKTMTCNKVAMFCSDPMSGSHFIVQTSKFMLIDATAVSLGQGHGKVIQYIFPRPTYSLCQISKVSLKRFWHERENFLAAADAAEMNWKHKVTPDRGYLNTLRDQIQHTISTKGLLHTHGWSQGADATKMREINHFKFKVIASMGSPENAWKPQIWPVSLKVKVMPKWRKSTGHNSVI